MSGTSWCISGLLRYLATRASKPCSGSLQETRQTFLHGTDHVEKPSKLSDRPFASAGDTKFTKAYPMAACVSKSIGKYTKSNFPVKPCLMSNDTKSSLVYWLGKLPM